jgi:hypothetical protein
MQWVSRAGTSRTCAGHDDGEPGPVRTGDEVLVPVQHPAAAGALRGGAQRGRVRPRTWRRLGHRETGAAQLVASGPSGLYPASSSSNAVVRKSAPERVIDAGDKRLLLQRNHRLGDEMADPLPGGFRASREHGADRHARAFCRWVERHLADGHGGSPEFADLSWPNF